MDMLFFFPPFGVVFFFFVSHPPLHTFPLQHHSLPPPRYDPSTLRHRRSLNGPLAPFSSPLPNIIRPNRTEQRASIRSDLLGRTEWPLFGQKGPNRGSLFNSIWPNSAEEGASAGGGSAGPVPKSGKEMEPRRVAMLGRGGDGSSAEERGPLFGLVWLNDAKGGASAGGGGAGSVPKSGKETEPKGDGAGKGRRWKRRRREERGRGERGVERKEGRVV